MHRVLAATGAVAAILTIVGLKFLPLDNAAHLGGLVTGAVIGTLFTARAPRNGWLAFAVAFAALLVNTTRPWWSPGDDKDLVAAYANAWLTGNVTGHPDGAWPIDIRRGLRLAEKGCTYGVALACEVLAQQLDREGDPAQRARAAELRRRTCELDPQLCAQVR